MRTIIDDLGWTLLHSLWEGAVIWVLFRWAQRLLARRSASLRCALGCGALLGAVVAFGLTFARLASTAGKVAVTVPFSPLSQSNGEGLSAVASAIFLKEPAGAVAMADVERLLPACVIGWLAGALWISATTLVELFDNRRLAARSGLLAHELAHVLRNDFVVNLLQCVCDALFFYHPAVRDISRQIRVERENACDDIAVGVCGDSHCYAAALVTLEEHRDQVAYGRVRFVTDACHAAGLSGVTIGSK